MPNAMITADTANVPALIASAEAGPTRATSTPAPAAPALLARRSIAPCTPVTRSIGTPAHSATRGGNTPLAASDGPRRVPMIATIGTNTAMCSAPTRCSTGTAVITTTLIRSAPTAIGLVPSRSTIGPTRNLLITYGSISAIATVPVIVGLPVVVSTSQGMAIMDNRVPPSEKASAVA